MQVGGLVLKEVLSSEHKFTPVPFMISSYDIDRLLNPFDLLKSLFYKSFRNTRCFKDVTADKNEINAICSIIGKIANCFNDFDSIVFHGASRLLFEPVEGHAYLPIGSVDEFHYSPTFSTAKKSAVTCIPLYLPVFNGTELTWP